MTTRAKVSKSALAEQFRAFIDPDFVITDDETLRPYECDGLAMYREMPMLVVLPETVEQVQRVNLEYHHHHGSYEIQLNFVIQYKALGSRKILKITPKIKSY